MIWWDADATIEMLKASPLLNEKRYLRVAGISTVLIALARNNVHNRICWVAIDWKVEAKILKIASSVLRLASKDLTTFGQEHDIIETVENLSPRLVDYRYNCDTKVRERFQKFHDRKRGRRVKTRSRFVKKQSHWCGSKLYAYADPFPLATRDDWLDRVTDQGMLHVAET